MTVPLTMRDDHQSEQDKELRVVTKATELALYTIEICKSEKNFPKKYRWCLTQKIVNYVTEVGCLIVDANAHRIDGEDKERVKRNLEIRVREQEKALGYLERSKFLMKVAYEAFGADSFNIDHWTTLKKNLTKILRAWNRSDAEKLNKMG